MAGEGHNELKFFREARLSATVFLSSDRKMKGVRGI